LRKKRKTPRDVQKAFEQVPVWVDAQEIVQHAARDALLGRDEAPTSFSIKPAYVRIEKDVIVLPDIGKIPMPHDIKQGSTITSCTVFKEHESYSVQIEWDEAVEEGD